MSKRYEMEFDMWRKYGFQMLPQRVKVVATSRAYAEKRMRDVVYKQGGYNGRYVAFYPNGTVKDGQNGFFFLDCHDFPDKLSAMIGLGKGSLAKLGTEASRSIEPYSMERFYRNISEVYKRVCKKCW